MNIINILFGTPFGAVIHFFYQLTNSYGLAILLFALFVRIVIFPITIMAQKNSIKLLNLQPELNRMKRWHTGERLSEEQYNLFKREGYKPLIGLVPLLIQLVLLIGVLQVMYNPLQHIVQLSPQAIDALTQIYREIYHTTGSAQEQILIMQAIPEHLPVFQAAMANVPQGDVILQSIINTDLQFMGVNLGVAPSFLNPSAELLIPFIVLIAMITMCTVQCLISPGALSQGRKTNLWFVITTVGIIFYFTAVTPTGVGLYWIGYGFLGAVAFWLLNCLYNPKKLAGEALAEIKANRKTPAQLKEEKREKRELSAREKKEVEKFVAAKKQLVFYAISGGQYKYYKTIIEYVLANSDITIHYVTNDPKDPLFSKEIKGLIPYYIGQRKTISVFLKLNCEMLVTTVPDLQTYHLKRSVVRDDIEYVYTLHGLLSTHLVIRETAFDHFDTVFCVGPHQVKEMRRREEMASMPRKKLIKAGYGHYDQLVLYYKELLKSREDKKQQKPRILIAPSWQEGNILASCVENLLEPLLGQGYEIIIRPHPQFTRMFSERMEELQKKYANVKDEVIFDTDFSNDESVFTSDMLITDWSNIGYEFAYSTLKPCVFINTPMKALNPYYEEYDIPALDIVLRDEVGVSIDPDNVKTAGEVVAKLLADKDAHKERIQKIVEEYVYYPGRNGEACGKYIINQLKSKEQ